MVELWQLDLHFLSLKKVVLSLFTDWRDHIELPCHRIGFLGRNEIATEFIPMSKKASL
jgi:hypothetical protein